MEIMANNIKMHYIDDGEGVPLIFLHGLSDDSRLWLPIIPSFSSKFRVLAPDLRGHGQSDKPDSDYSVELFAEDLYEFLDKLNLNQVNLVGLSLGGAIAQQFALDHPEMVHKLVLMSSFSQVDTALGTKLKGLIQDLDTDGVPAFFDDAVELVNTPDFISENLEVIKEVKVEAEKFNSPRALKQVMEGMLYFDIKDRITAINCPVLIFSGREDIFTPLYLSQEIQEALDNSQWIIVDDVGHNLLIPGKIEEIIDIIKEFLDG